MTERKGDWIQTYTGKAFWPLDPRADEVNILDIAHALSNICRYTGHVSRFYSVAEHSVLVSLNVPPEYAMWGLLHDASEAYLTDIARPVKKYLTNYRDIEHGIMSAVAEHFLLQGDEPEIVKVADNRILLDEKAALFRHHPPRPWDAIEGGPLGVDIAGHYPATAEEIFLKRYFSLRDKS